MLLLIKSFCCLGYFPSRCHDSWERAGCEGLSSLPPPPSRGDPLAFALLTGVTGSTHVPRAENESSCISPSCWHPLHYWSLSAANYTFSTHLALLAFTSITYFLYGFFIFQLNCNKSPPNRTFYFKSYWIDPLQRCGRKRDLSKLQSEHVTHFLDYFNGSYITLRMKSRHFDVIYKTLVVFHRA